MHASNNISAHQNACWKSTNKTVFSDVTSPGAKWYNGSQSGLRCYEISSAGASMTYKFGIGTVAGTDKATIPTTPTVYPNPSPDGTFHLSNSCVWEVHSLQGIFIEKGTGDHLDLSRQSKGMYLLNTAHEVQVLINQ